MEVQVCDRCGEISDSVDQCGVFRVTPRHWDWRFSEDRHMRQQTVALNADGRYVREEISNTMIKQTNLIDLCPRCVEVLLQWVESQRCLKHVVPRMNQEK